MGPIGIALEFIHARKWLVELLLVAALVGGVWYWHHTTLESGIARGIATQKAEDDRASADLRKQVAKLSADNLLLAAAAKAKYETDHAANLAAAHAPVGTSQLCKPTYPHDSSGGMRPDGGRNPGDAQAPAGPEVGGGLPTADHGLADDRRALLGAFAALFDDQTAVIREYQGRQK